MNWDKIHPVFTCELSTFNLGLFAEDLSKKIYFVLFLCAVRMRDDSVAVHLQVILSGKCVYMVKRHLFRLPRRDERHKENILEVRSEFVKESWSTEFLDSI